jgi:undecaprenyl-diphosphatase
MTTILEALLLGIVQGITEWLPVSSSGHLAIIEHFLGIEQPLLMNIFLHIGTLIVVFIVFYQDIIRIVKAILRLDFKSEHGRLALFIIIGSVPTALIGYFFHDVFASFFTSMKVISIALIVTGVMLFFSERFEGKRELDWIDSLIIGAAQGIAIIPGISRSGATISSALISGIDKKKAARFSFLLMVPAVIGAAILEFDSAAIGADLVPIVIGTLTAVIVGYLSLKFLLRVIMKHRFHAFSYYCLAIGILLLIYAF